MARTKPTAVPADDTNFLADPDSYDLEVEVEPDPSLVAVKLSSLAPTVDVSASVAAANDVKVHTSTKERGGSSTW